MENNKDNTNHQKNRKTKVNETSQLSKCQDLFIDIATILMGLKVMCVIWMDL